jgi:hypothetical protein
MFENARPNERTNMTIISGLLQEMCQKVGNAEREYALTEIGIEKDLSEPVKLHAGMDVCTF